MGNLFACIDEIPSDEREHFDMSVIRKNHVPIVWLVGPPGSGRSTQADILSENLGYEIISVAGLIKNEAEKETAQGESVKQMLESGAKKLPDTIVVDLIKEEMLKRASQAKGFILNGFPRTNRQAVLFTKEVREVDVVFYLYSETYKMVSRIQEKMGSIDEENIKKGIYDYVKDVKDGTAKFSGKVEKIYTDAPPRDVFNKIESALNLRLKRINMNPLTPIM